MFFLFTLRKCDAVILFPTKIPESRFPALHSKPNRRLHFSVTYLNTFPARRVNVKRTLRMLTFKPTVLQWLLKPAVKTQLEGYLSLAVTKGFITLLCLLVFKTRTSQIC